MRPWEPAGGIAVNLEERHPDPDRYRDAMEDLGERPPPHFQEIAGNACGDLVRHLLIFSG